MVAETKKPVRSATDDEIDLVALVKPLWAERLTLLKYAGLAGILGLIFAIFAPKEYIATSIMVPSGYEGSSKISGLTGIGGLAAMAGININTSLGSDLSPLIYPKIVTSLPFQLELMKTQLTIKGINKPVSFLEYYTEIQKPNIFLKYTLGLPGVIINIFKGEEKENIITGNIDEPLELTSKQRDLHLLLEQLVSLEADPKEGILTLSTAMPEPKAAAQLGQRAQQLLQQYITDFKIKKAKANLDFIQQRVNETFQKFDLAQQKLATFRDHNKNVSLATVKTEEERLTSQYNLIYGVYAELSKQLENAKIQVKQETPIFTIIEPVSVPTKKSKPNRPLIIFTWLFIGALIGSVIVYNERLKTIK